MTSHHLGLKGLDDLALLIGNSFNDHGYKSSAIGNGREASCKLYPRNRNALAKGDRVQGNGRPISRMLDNSLSLPRKADPCLFSEAEGADVSIESLLPDLLSNLRCSDVTRNLDDLPKVEPSVLRMIVDGAVIDRVDSVLAKVGIRDPCHLFLQGRGPRNTLNMDPARRCRNGLISQTWVV
jgi:hypothetical protein